MYATEAIGHWRSVTSISVSQASALSFYDTCLYMEAF